MIASVCAARCVSYVLPSASKFQHIVQGPQQTALKEKNKITA